MPDTLPSVLPPNVFQPLFLSSLGDDAVDLAAVTGLFLDDWQAEVVRTSLTFKGDLDSKFAARQMLLLVPRQQGKGSCIEARELAGLFLLHEPTMLHTAHEFRTAQSSFKRLKDRIDYAAEVLDADKIRFRNSGAETSILVPGDRAKGVPDSYLMFTPRTAGAGRGLSVDLLIIDEAYALTADQVSALRPTQNAVRRPQMWATSSTGFPESMELMAMREQGLNRVENMGFFEWKADDGCDPGDRDQWYQAIPGLRTGRQDIDEIIVAYEHARATGNYTDFNREYLGLWATNDIGALISQELWGAQKYPPEAEPPKNPPKIALAVDVDPISEGAAVVGVGQDENGFFVPFRLAEDKGVTWVADWLKIKQETRPNHYVTVLDPMAPAGALKDQFDAVGVEYVELTSSQCIQACSKFETFVRDGRIRHTDDPDMNDAVNNGVKRLIGAKGAWLWAPKIEGARIRSLVAATYALFGLTAVEPPEKRSGDFWW